MKQICYLASRRSLAPDLEQANSFPEIFSLVQHAVSQTIGESRAGLNLGVMELGNPPNGFLGAYYPVGSNIIVLNSTPLRRISETQPELFRPYVFHVLLHEYLHTLGYLDEGDVRRMSQRICKAVLGDDHVALEMIVHIERFFPSLLYPGGSPARKDKMFLVEDLDQGMDYIG